MDDIMKEVQRLIKEDKVSGHPICGLSKSLEHYLNILIAFHILRSNFPKENPQGLISQNPLQPEYDLKSINQMHKQATWIYH